MEIIGIIFISSIIILMVVTFISLFFLGLTLNKYQWRRIETKFELYLLKQCKKENIKLELFDKLEDFNKNETTQILRNKFRRL